MTALWPVLARAQSSEQRRVSVLYGTADTPEGRSWLDALRQSLRDGGWEEGRNLVLDVRWGGANQDRIAAAVADMVRSKPDVIACRSVRVLRALQRATRDIPVVFVATADPVGQGFVASLARPGGNLTGFTIFEYSIAGKLVQILKDVAPHIVRVGFLFNPVNLGAPGNWRSVQEVAPALGVAPEQLPVRDAPTIEAALAEFASRPNGGLILPTDATTVVHRATVIAQAARHRLPAIYTYRADVRAGGLISYGTDLVELFRRAGGYVDRILKGEKPGDLPVQTPTQFEMAINLRTAAALGLAVPQHLLARADEVIE